MEEEGGRLGTVEEAEGGMVEENRTEMRGGEHKGIGKMGEKMMREEADLEEGGKREQKGAIVSWR